MVYNLVVIDILEILDKNIVYIILTTPAILRATPPKLGRKVPKFVPSF